MKLPRRRFLNWPRAPPAPGRAANRKRAHCDLVVARRRADLGAGGVLVGAEPARRLRPRRGLRALAQIFPGSANWVWSDWEPLGGVLNSPPAAVSWGEGRIDVFVRGTDRALWHKWFTDNEWSDWELLGGVLNFGPAVASWGPGRLDVFARGTDNTIFQRTFAANNWLDWTRVPDPSPALTVALPGITAVAWPDTIELFTWAQSRHLPTSTSSTRPTAPAAGRTCSPSGTSSPSPPRRPRPAPRWLWPPGATIIRCSIGSCAAPTARWRTARALACGGDVSSRKRFGPASRGGFLTSGPAAVASRDRIDVIVRGGDNALWHMWLRSEAG